MVRKFPLSERLTGKILISRLSAHGDVIQTLPLLAAIKQADPTVFVGWVVEASAAPLLENHPLIDRLHVSHRKAWLRGLLGNPLAWPGLLAQIREFVQGLRQEHYSVGVDVQGLLKSALMLVLAGIPRRIGYRRTREWADRLYTETIAPHDLHNPRIATVDKFREFLVPLGYCKPPTQPTPYADYPPARFPLPPVSSESRERVTALLQGLDPGRPLIALAPTTIWPSKHWEESGWQTLLRHLTPAPLNLLLIGTQADRPALDRLLPVDLAQRPHTVRNLAGQTTLGDLIALFHDVDVLIGLDSAPLHIASAVASERGRPRILGIYGPTAPLRTGPWGAQHQTLATDLACQPCFERRCPLGTHDCMTRLTPDLVFSLLQPMIAESSRVSQMP